MSQKVVKTDTLEPLILLGLETFFTKNHILALPLAKKEVISNHAEETSHHHLLIPTPTNQPTD